MKNDHEVDTIQNQNIKPISDFTSKQKELCNPNLNLFEYKSDKLIQIIRDQSKEKDEEINKFEIKAKGKNDSFIMNKNNNLKGNKNVKLSKFLPLKKCEGDELEIKEPQEDLQDNINTNHPKNRVASTVFKIPINFDKGVIKQKSPSIHEIIYLASEIEEYEKQQFELVKKTNKVSQHEIAAHKINLPIYSLNLNKKTLVVSLENNLIYLVPNTNKIIKYETKIPIIKISKNEEMNDIYFLLLRPFSVEFLKRMSEFYEIIVFSSFEKVIVEEIVKYLDPQNKYISHFLNQYHCIKKDKLFIRNISIIENRNFCNVIYVTESLNDFRDKINNGILVNPFIGKPHDNELESVSKLLINLSSYEDDVRIVLKEIYKLEDKFNIYIQEGPNEVGPGQTSKKVFFPQNLL